MPKINIQSEAIRLILSTSDDTCLVYRFITSSVNQRKLKPLLLNPYDTSTSSNYLVSIMVTEMINICGYNWVYYITELEKLSDSILNKTVLKRNSFEDKDILSYTRAQKSLYMAQTKQH